MIKSYNLDQLTLNYLNPPLENTSKFINLYNISINLKN
jgi:hypothetical protein